jgi:hypothetical protein
MKYEYDDIGYLSKQPPEEAFSITFHLKLETVKNFGPQLTDIKWADQLWEVAKKGLFTDVDFVIGEAIFHAHRFIVSSRSPVIATMLNPRWEEGRTGRVTITNDVDPMTFQLFLKFLYTGQIEFSVLPNKQLLHFLYSTVLCITTQDEKVNFSYFTKRT